MYNPDWLAGSIGAALTCVQSRLAGRQSELVLNELGHEGGHPSHDCAVSGAGQRDAQKRRVGETAPDGRW